MADKERKLVCGVRREDQDVDGGAGLDRERDPRLCRRRVYARRQDTSSGSSPTLWVARGVIQADKASFVIQELDRLRVADRMQAIPRPASW